jgi:hypothetical protein
LSFGASAHFATKGSGATATVSKASSETNNIMGPVTNNSGINTQGQRGDNAIGQK